ncbi:MAG: GNAT family N-acetyltransferase [Anaerolineales bacterium]|nr:GNAT family N-acetyltransferase [Anaerolineales bacterium]
MFGERKTTVRPANPSDRNTILTLVRFETHGHAHLDWRPVEDWLGTQPYLLAERGRRALGALAAPPDPPDTAWLRLFVVVDDVPPVELWNLLWPRTAQALAAAGVRTAAALSLDSWIDPLVKSAGFQQTHSVVVLSRRRGPAPSPSPSPARIRPAQPADYEAVAATDLAAFASPWQMSAAVIADAIRRADYLTVAEVEGQVAGYQLTTPTSQGAHLARLAVQPAWQGQGIGGALVADLIEHANRRNYRELTVNTQDNNAGSLAVYQRLGFVRGAVQYPVYLRALR